MKLPDITPDITAQAQQQKILSSFNSPLNDSFLNSVLPNNSTYQRVSFQLQ